MSAYSRFVNSEWNRLGLSKLCKPAYRGSSFRMPSKLLICLVLFRLFYGAPVALNSNKPLENTKNHMKVKTAPKKSFLLV